MSRSKQLVPAVAYLRKSTKGERAEKNGQKKQRQEKSITQQKEESAKLADSGGFQVVKWFTDEGISGWKREGKRPDFERMLNEVRSLGAQAVICDNLDRFSRATVDEVQADAARLRAAGVRWIVTNSHGTYDLGARNDIAEILKFVVSVWASHESSRQLGRRITLWRRNRTLERKRSGSPAPYGWKLDGEGGLKHGDKREVKTVRFVFQSFADGWSLNAIAADLNQRKIPSPSGKLWQARTLAAMIRNQVYRGDFVFNKEHGGQFFGIDADGEVVESSELKGPGKLFEFKGEYTPMVDPKLFDKANKRLANIGQNRSLRKASYALSGVLVCDHCGTPMFGSSPKDQKSPVYKCGANAKAKGQCGYHSIRESEILPFILRLLGEEIKDVRAMLSVPPEELREPNKRKQADRERLASERAELLKRISLAEENLLFSEDKRTRRALDCRLTEMRDRLESLDRELDEAEPSAGYSREDLEALNEWWDEFTKEAVSVPIPGKLPVLAHFYQDPWSDEQAVLINARRVNAALKELGCEIRLRWESETLANGRKRHRLARGRFRLGQKEGDIYYSGKAVALPWRMCGFDSRWALYVAGRGKVWICQWSVASRQWSVGSGQ